MRCPKLIFWYQKFISWCQTMATNFWCKKMRRFSYIVKCGDFLKSEEGAWINIQGIACPMKWPRLEWNAALPIQLHTLLPLFGQGRQQQNVSLLKALYAFWGQGYLQNIKCLTSDTRHVGILDHHILSVKKWLVSPTPRGTNCFSRSYIGWVSHSYESSWNS